MKATRPLLHRRLHLLAGMGSRRSVLSSPGRSPGSAGICSLGSLWFRWARARLRWLVGAAVTAAACSWLGSLAPRLPTLGRAPRSCFGGSVAVTSVGLTDSVWPPDAVRSLHRTGGEAVGWSSRRGGPQAQFRGRASLHRDLLSCGQWQDHQHWTIDLRMGRSTRA